MNKQELIEKYKAQLKDCTPFGRLVSHDLIVSHFLDDLKQLDEPQKPVVPQFVADWLKYCKFTGVELQHALNMEDLYFYNYANQKDDLKLKEFFETENNQDIFARAWLDGYTVEKEKRYRVSLKNGQPLLKAYLGKALYFSQDIAIERYEVTRKELEEAGFGEVFSSPLFEVEEVQDDTKI